MNSVTRALHDLPREKLERIGPRNVSDAELVAILLRTGTRNMPVVRLAEHLLQHTQGVFGLGSATVEDLAALPGVGRVKAMTIVTALELARRWYAAGQQHAPVFNSSDIIFAYYATQLRGRPAESFIAIALDSKNRLLREQWFNGDACSAPVSPRAVFATALACQAAAIAIVHNHPSGDPTPSDADHQVTGHIAATGHLLQVPLLDHIIVGTDCYYSFRDEGFLDATV